MAAGLDAERGARCSFCRKHDWEVGRLVASADNHAFLCDECEATAHVVMTETPVPLPRGTPPVNRKPLRIDWQKLRHHQTHGPRQSKPGVGALASGETLQSQSVRYCL
jgi:hypothetical protein